jgi:hypothetical protein
VWMQHRPGVQHDPVLVRVLHVALVQEFKPSTRTSTSQHCLFLRGRRRLTAISHLSTVCCTRHHKLQSFPCFNLTYL